MPEDQTMRPLAVVTGASSGIGYELAKVFAKNGYDLFVVAEDSGITEAAQAFASTGANVEKRQINLSTFEGVELFYSGIKSLGRPIDAIAINAGVGAGGEFVTNDLKEELKMIDLNVKSTVHLAELVLKDMVARNEGMVLITSSIAALMPGPFNAVYAATKSFVQSFAEGIRGELEDTEVIVTSLMPGPTDTKFFDRAGMQDTAVGAGKKDDPAEVAEQGFRALMEGRDHVVAGSFKNKAQAVASKVLSDPMKAKMHGKMNEPGSAGEAEDLKT